MNYKLLASIACAAGLALAVTLRASEAPKPAAVPVDPTTAAFNAAFNTQVQSIVAKINTKLQKGLRAESDFAPELSELNTLIASHQGEKTDAVAAAAYTYGLLYIKYFNQPEKALAVFKQVSKDFPATSIGKQLAIVIPQLEAQITAPAYAPPARKVLPELEVGKTFPAFAVASGEVKDIEGKPLSLAQYHGKIVLVDFWATWCQPCMLEMPNVIAAYQKFHSKGFDIIGISLDQPAGVATLPAFLKAHQMPWRQFADGKFWDNELAVKYGIQSIPSSFLLDGNGKVIAISPRGPALVPAIEAALAAQSAGKS